jgi:SWI/SNF-related matrix-associated actin-dependent regulator of chromatin subfamily A3
MASSSSSGHGGGDSEPCLVGFVVTQIVGMRYYQGKITGREPVGLVRQPLNPYDGNAISVVNGRGDQVGHIQRPVAAVLAPLIDSQLLTVQGIVPKAASKSVHRVPCQIHLFARPAAFPAVAAAIRDGGLDLIHADHPEFGLSEAAAVVTERTKRKPDRNVDKLFSLVGKKEGKSQIEPMEAPGDVVASELFDHQKEALGWLVHREESDDLPPFWEESNEGGFENVLTGQNVKERPAPLKGRIFADDMGLGKTLVSGIGLRVVLRDRLGQCLVGLNVNRDLQP